MDTTIKVVPALATQQPCGGADRESRENNMKKAILVGIVAALTVLTVVTTTGGSQTQIHRVFPDGGFIGINH